MEKSQKINAINRVLAAYFANPNNPRVIPAKEMMPQFVSNGVFPSDLKNGLPIRKLLRELDESGQLSSIPYVMPERKEKNTNWFFVATMEGTHEPVVRKSSPIETKPKDNNGRCDSDEFYIISLCNKVLNRTASQQHKFDFLVGDNGCKLPVDAYYEDLNLVVEYHERQHTEAVKLFDTKMTVSGVSRGEQRRIYDDRRQKVLPEHGIKLIVIDYSDFGTSKKLQRNPEKDVEIIKRILGENGAL